MLLLLQDLYYTNVCILVPIYSNKYLHMNTSFSIYFAVTSDWQQSNNNIWGCNEVEQENSSTVLCIVRALISLVILMDLVLCLGWCLIEYDKSQLLLFRCGYWPGASTEPAISGDPVVSNINMVHDTRVGWFLMAPSNHGALDMGQFVQYVVYGEHNGFLYFYVYPKSKCELFLLN